MLSPLPVRRRTDSPSGLGRMLSRSSLPCERDQSARVIYKVDTPAAGSLIFLPLRGIGISSGNVLRSLRRSSRGSRVTTRPPGSTHATACASPGERAHQRQTRAQSVWLRAQPHRPSIHPSIPPSLHPSNRCEAANPVPRALLVNSRGCNLTAILFVVAGCSK